MRSVGYNDIQFQSGSTQADTHELVTRGEDEGMVICELCGGILGVPGSRGVDPKFHVSCRWALDVRHNAKVVLELLSAC